MKLQMKIWAGVLLMLWAVMPTGELAAKESADIMITHARIVTMNENKDIIEDGVLVIKDHRIVAVGSKELAGRYGAPKVMDAKGDIVMPGFVNTHTHASMTVFRSLADDVPDRLTKYIFPLEKKMVSRQMVYTGAVHGILEMVRSGITTFADMYYFEDEVAKAATEIGARGVLGETVIKFPVADAPVPFGGIAYTLDFIEKYKGNPLVTPAFAPHAPYTMDSDHLRQVSELAKLHDVPVLMHVAETPEEAKLYQDKYGMTPVEYLNSLGVLDERLVAAHCIFVNERDMQLMAEKQVGVAHNMVANIKSAKGVSPALTMFDRGMRVGLGTDGPMSGNTLDIIGQMGYVAKVHKLATGDRSAMPPWKVVEMATVGGAKALHMEDRIGSLEAGKLADVIVVDTTGLNMIPLYDVYSALVYSAYPTDVRHVIVHGRVIMEDRRIQTYEEEKGRKAMGDFAAEVSKVAKTLE